MAPFLKSSSLYAQLYVLLGWTPATVDSFTPSDPTAIEIPWHAFPLALPFRPSAGSSEHESGRSETMLEPSNLDGNTKNRQHQIRNSSSNQKGVEELDLRGPRRRQPRGRGRATRNRSSSHRHRRVPGGDPATGPFSAQPGEETRQRRKQRQTRQKRT